MTGLNSSIVKSLFIPLPELYEQRKIIDYLDKENGIIDSLIDEAKASIEEYKAWKASIIYEAVTKGLDKDVEMKDSGMDVIGNVPNAWSVCRLKNVISIPLQYGANETGVPFDAALPRYIRITDVTSDGRLKEEGKLSLTEEMAVGYILEDNDILFARSGATVGKAFLYRSEYGRSAFAGYMIRAKINKSIIHPKIVYYTTMSSHYENWKASMAVQATIQNIGANRYNELPIVVPIMEEQERIVSYLDDQSMKIDTLIYEKESLISDLEAYKKSLIFEAVTGKWKVV